MQPYRILCLTCSAALKIDDPSMIGQIFNCPKCHSMVMVTPPTNPTPAASHDPTATPVPPVAPPPRQATVASSSALAPPATATTAASPVVGAAQPTGTFPWKKWSVLGGSGAAGALLVVGVWFIALKPDRPVDETPKTEVAVAPVGSLPSAAPTSAQPATEKPKATPDVDAQVKAIASPPQPAAVATAKKRDSDEANSVKQQQPVRASRPQPKQETEDRQQVRVPIEAQPVQVPLRVRTVEAPFANLPARPARQLPPPSAALTARLALPLASVKMPAVPLRALLETIGALGAVQIQCDPSALTRTGLTLEDTAAIETKSASLAELLEEVLKSRGLTFVATGDQVVITIPEASGAPHIHVRHAVDDLAPDRAQREQLAELVRAVVLPATWQPAGRGKLALDHGALVVDQGAEAQWQIRQLCESFGWRAGWRRGAR